MSRFKLPALVLVGLVAIASIANASYWTAQPPQRPSVLVMAPGAPTTLTSVAAAELHTTLSAVGMCVRIDCSVDSAYVLSPSGSAVTLASTTAGNDLPAKTVESFCLPKTQNYISFWTTAAGVCKVSERAAP